MYNLQPVSACPDNSKHLSDVDCRNGGESLRRTCVSDYECGFYADFGTECDSRSGICCTIPESAQPFWDTCANGGYAMAKPCRSTRDCFVGGSSNRNPQVCVNRECCTIPYRAYDRQDSDSDEESDSYGRIHFSMEFIIILLFRILGSMPRVGWTSSRRRLCT